MSQQPENGNGALRDEMASGREAPYPGGGFNAGPPPHGYGMRPTGTGSTGLGGAQGMGMGNPHGVYNASSGMAGYGGMPQLFGGGVSGAANQQPGLPGVGQLAPHQQLRGGPSPLMGLMGGNGQVRRRSRSQ